MLEEERVEVVVEVTSEVKVGRPNVPKSKEDLDPMLKNCLLWWLIELPPFKSNPPRTLFNSPQMPEVNVLVSLFDDDEDGKKFL